jgi:hypothetical protein
MTILFGWSFLARIDKAATPTFLCDKSGVMATPFCRSTVTRRFVGGRPRNLSEARIYLFYRTSKGDQRSKRDPSLRFDFVDRRKLILLVTFAGGRDDHPSRMSVLPRASNR